MVYVTVNRECACCFNGGCHSEHGVFMVYVTVNRVCAWCVHDVCHSEQGVRMLCLWFMSQ